jgi:hypothetical protein
VPAPAYPTARASRGLLRGQHRGRRLLDDLLVAALDRAVPDPERPRGALAVGDDLDLDVTRSGDQALEEDHAAAERALRLVAGPPVGVRHLLVRRDLADAAPATTGGGLEHDRVADLVGLGDRVVEGVERSTAPRGDRDTDLLRDELRADLVAEPSHGLGARADEGDPDALAELGERGILGDEPPADPGGVRSGVEQRLLQDREVQVGTGRGGSEVVGQVGLAHEHRSPLALGV